MADINPTVASVKPGTNAQTQRVTLGATVTQGMALYLDTSDNKYKIADCTTSPTTAAVVGIALSAGADGQPGVIQTDGYVTFGADLTANTIYVLSTGGMLAPAADFSAVTDYLTVVGCAVSTTSLKLGINATGSGKTG